MSTHRLLLFRNLFTAGTNALGGRFSAKVPGLNFTPDHYIVRMITYDGADGIQYPLILSCEALGGVLGVFLSANSQAVGAIAPQVSCPSTFISNSAGVSISGQDIEFTVTSAATPGTPVTGLSGSLAILIEVVKKAPKKSKEEKKY